MSDEPLSGLVPLDPDAQYFVGQLVANERFDDVTPDGYCLEDGHLWLGSPWRVGRLNLFGHGDVPQALRGKVVLVKAQRGASLADAVHDSGPCEQDQSPSRQFRSDWMSDEGGYRTTHEALAAVGFLRGAVVQEVVLLEVDDPGAGKPRRWRPTTDDRQRGIPPVRVKVYNPFAVRLSGLNLVVHHEGGRGKPMPRYEKHAIDLEPGATFEIEVSLIIEELVGGQEGTWRFDSAYLVGKSGSLEILGSPFFRIGD